MGMANDEWITTAEAARLTGREQITIRNAIAANLIPGTKDPDGHWLLPRDELLAWHARTPPTRPYRRRRGPPYDQLATLLTQYGRLDAAELSELIGIHAGNVRKHLLALAEQGRAHRLSDGRWELRNPSQRTLSA